MIKDITLGQYFPGNSMVHRLDPRYKIIISGIFIAMLFIGDHVICLEIGAVFVAMALILSSIPLKMIVKSIKPIIPLLLFTSLFNIFFISGGMPIFEWKFIKITDAAVHTTFFMFVRIILLIAGTSLLTYTTSPIALTDAIERLLSPLKKIKVPVHDLAMMMTIALRFIPTLLDETDKIIKAQQARGADFDTGGIMQKAKSLIPILVPLFISAFRRADELAMAMEARCYRGGGNRTRMNEMVFTKVDYIGCVVVAAFVAAIILLLIIF